MRSQFEDKKTIALLTLPAAAVMVFAIGAPLLVSAYFGFTKWNGFGAVKWVGLDNYAELLTADATFRRSLLNVAILILATVLLQNPLAFAVAAVLAKRSEGASRVLRTIYFIPATLSLVVVTKLWVNIFNPSYGVLNKLLAAAGLGGAELAWLSDPRTALGSVVWIILWQGFGWALLFYYAGLMTLPKELEEAARVDGAGRWRLYSRVVVPCLLPVIESVVVIDVISSLKQMEMIYLSTEGGPGNYTQFIAVYLYQKAFKYSEYGYGNAVSVLFVAIAVVLTLLVQRAFRSAEKE